MSADGNEQFFRETLEAFEQAAERIGREERRIGIGPDHWRLRFAGRRFCDRMFPACAHLETPEGAADWTIHFFDSTTSGVSMPAPPWGPDQYRAAGTLAGYEEGRYRCFYQPGVDVLYALDLDRRMGFYWVPDLERLPWWEPSFPLRVILHWAYARFPWQPLHAGAVGLPTGGVLVAGPSGVGKSTTTLACLDSDLGYAGDDYVLVGLDPDPVVHSLYNTAKVEPGNLERLPFLSGWLANAARLGEEKAMVYLAQYRPEKLIREFPIRAIVLPQVTGEVSSRCVPVAASDAMHAIARTCLHHLPYHADALVRKVGRLCRAVPVYCLQAGTDLRQIPLRLLDLITSLS